MTSKQNQFLKTLRDYFLTHSWWGKILGGFFGYLIGRSTGAIFGILIGNFFDRGLVAHLSRPHWQYHAEKREIVQKIFFEATFTVMGHIAKADGRVSENEIEMARTLMKEMQLNTKQKSEAKRYFSHGKSPDFNLSRMLNLLLEHCKLNPELLKLFVDIQYRAAQIDGLSEKKIKALDIIFLGLGLAPLHRQYRFYQDFGHESSRPHQRKQHQGHQSHKQRATNASTLDQAYALLELNANASQQEVKKAYRRLISRNHPDKLIAQGLPEQMIKMANEKTQNIRKAYEYICTSKGWHH